jgi:adenine-specific DNA methylase
MLIESAMPIKEISAESVRDKSIRHGHLSTLHLWWVRRPLPVCRAVVFASLVPDPLDPACPKQFQDAAAFLLGRENQIGKIDYYKPYDDIPFTQSTDPMEDNLRNRLLMFIGKFSETFLANEKRGKTTPAKDQLSQESLITWENRNNERTLNIARKLIWVAHDPEHNTLAAFDECYGALRGAEKDLEGVVDRHQGGAEVKARQKTLDEAVESFLSRMPKVFDPFAGGGAIPLEAARLGCRTFANDLNPVAHIIQKGSLEFPQRYGKPIIYSTTEFEGRYGTDAMNRARADGRVMGKEVHIANRLSFDVEHYAKKLLARAEDEIGSYYPADDKGNRPVAYYWARVATCSNPSCRAKVPLLRQFYLVNKPDKQVYLKPVISGNRIDFEIRHGKTDEEGWMRKANLHCPCCGNVTDTKSLKAQFKSGDVTQKLLATIYESSGGKEYRIPTEKEIDVVEKIPDAIDIPQDKMEVGNNRNFNTPGWGIDSFGQMFSPRQLLAMQTFVEKLGEIKAELNPAEDDYDKAVVTYLGILVDRVAMLNTAFGRYHISGEKLEHPFARQAIPMIFDYPESNPFCESSGSARNQLDWILRYIDSESSHPFATVCRNAASGDRMQFDEKELDAVVTDPPYYDAIAYADLSDFFYVWLKRTLVDLYPSAFAFPQTPKTDECTALKHHHHGSLDEAKEHFETKLMEIFTTLERQTSGLMSVMFAHQSTEAWTTLCNAILAGGMNISGSWAINTEMGARMIAMDKAALASSVTVSCRPTERTGVGDFREIREAIVKTIRSEVRQLYGLGFRGVDLLTACFGQAVREFGRYSLVEKADGSPVTVVELLETAREAAFNAIVSDIDSDELSRFYIGWLNLFGFTEAAHDDVRRITQIGLSVDVAELHAAAVLVRNGNKESLATCDERIAAHPALGTKPGEPDINTAHRLMKLYDGGDRNTLLSSIATHAPKAEAGAWRVLASLAEILPPGSQDHQRASGLLDNKNSLLHDAEQAAAAGPEQQEFGFQE